MRALPFVKTVCRKRKWLLVPKENLHILEKCRQDLRENENWKWSMGDGHIIQSNIVLD